MDEDAPHHLRLSRVVVRAVATIVLVPALYVLSIGPVQWLLMARSEALDRFVDRIYAPVEWLSYSLNLQDSLHAYQIWWWILPGGGYERAQAKWLNNQVQPPRTEGR